MNWCVVEIHRIPSITENKTQYFVNRHYRRDEHIGPKYSSHAVRIYRRLRYFPARYQIHGGRIAANCR